MPCRCLGGDYSFEHQKKLAVAFYRETGEVCAVYEFDRGQYRFMPIKNVAKGIKILFETKDNTDAGDKIL